jgi:hypothetical protein
MKEEARLDQEKPAHIKVNETSVACGLNKTGHSKAMQEDMPS